MSELEVYERTFRTTVHMKRSFLGAQDLEIEHRGPATFKLDGKGNLTVETYPKNSDFEVQAALVVADTFIGVTQEELPEETDKSGLEENQESSDGINLDREIQVHNADDDEVDW